jgi:hypothetical protein
MYKSITGNEVQDHLVNQFMDSRYFGTQHWFAAREEIKALNEKILELNLKNEDLEKKLHGLAEKGSAPSGKSEKVKKGE